MQERARDWRMWSYSPLPMFPSSTSTSARSARPGVGIRGPKLVFSRTSPFGSRSAIVLWIHVSDDLRRPLRERAVALSCGPWPDSSELRRVSDV